MCHALTCFFATLSVTLGFDWTCLSVIGLDDRTQTLEEDLDAEAEAVATICLISTPPEVRAAESRCFYCMLLPASSCCNCYDMHSLTPLDEIL